MYNLAYNLAFYINSKEPFVELKEDWESLLSKVALSQCRNSYRRLFDRFYPILISQNLKAGVTKEVANELAQESMLKIWTKANEFDGSKGKVETWIFIIGRNVRFDYFRKKRNDPLKLNSEEIYHEVDHHLFSEDQMDLVIDSKIIQQHVNQLPEEYKILIQKIYIEGWTQQEASDHFKLPLGTVKTKSRFGLQMIQDLLKDRLL